MVEISIHNAMGWTCTFDMDRRMWNMTAHGKTWKARAQCRQMISYRQHRWIRTGGRVLRTGLYQWQVMIGHLQNLCDGNERGGVCLGCSSQHLSTHCGPLQATWSWSWDDGLKQGAGGGEHVRHLQLENSSGQECSSMGKLCSLR